MVQQNLNLKKKLIIFEIYLWFVFKHIHLILGLWFFKK